MIQDNLLSVIHPSMQTRNIARFAIFFMTFEFPALVLKKKYAFIFSVKMECALPVNSVGQLS